MIGDWVTEGPLVSLTHYPPTHHYTPNTRFTCDVLVSFAVEREGKMVTSIRLQIEVNPVV